MDSIDFMEIHGFHTSHGNPWIPCISWKSMESMDFMETMDFMEIHGINGFPWTMPRPAEAYYEGGARRERTTPPAHGVEES